MQASVSRSLGVGLSVSAGFLVVFGLAGLAIYHLQASIYEWVPVGDDRDRDRARRCSASPCCAGFEPVVALPKMQRGGRTTRRRVDVRVRHLVRRSRRSRARCRCSPARSWARSAARTSLSSVAVFVAYALGMTLVLLALTVSLGMAKQGHGAAAAPGAPLRQPRRRGDHRGRRALPRPLRLVRAPGARRRRRRRVDAPSTRSPGGRATSATG